MCRRFIPLWFLLFLCSPFGLLATEVTEAGWNGRDFVITFSDSAHYQIDLAETDSTVVVIRFPAANISATAKLHQLRNRHSGNAAFSPLPDGGLRLTLTSRSRFGYSTIWRPFTKRLIVHTFDWNGLPYNQEQYHKGLLALESGLQRQAEELLGVAFATGEQRAASVLGVMYARAGNDSLAARYLAAPADEDDRQALLLLGQQKNGVSEPNGTHSGSVSGTPPTAGESSTSQHSPAERTPSTSRSFMETFNDWRVLVAVIGGLLLFIIALAILVRSSRKKTAPSPTEAQTTAQTEEPAIRVVRGANATAPVIPPAAATQQAPAPTPPPTPTASTPESLTVQPPQPTATAPVMTEPVAHVAPVVAAPPIPAPPKVLVATATAAPITETTVPVAPEAAAEKSVQPAIVQPVIVQPAPAATIITEQKLKQPVGGLIELESAAAAVAPTSTAPARKTAATELAETEAKPQPSPQSQQRISGQALQLQQRIEAARRGEVVVSSADVPAVYEARRLNVSRDNVELRRRISDLKQKES